MRWIPLVCVALMMCSCVEMPEPNSDASGTLSSREQALIFAADGAAQHGDTATAERDYRAAMALSSGSVDAHLGLAQLYLRTNRSSDARAVLEQALALRFEDPLANYLIGKIYIQNGEYEKAGEAFQRGLITKPDDLDLSIGLAVTKDMRREHRAAQEIYQRAMTQHPDTDLTNLRTDFAMSCLLSGQTERAIELLRDDAAKPNAVSVTRHNLALAYGLLGRDDEARRLLHGDVDEQTRLQSVARLKEYLTKQAAGGSSPAPTPPPATEMIVPEKSTKPEKPKKKAPAAKPVAATSAPRPAPADAIPNDIPSAFSE